MSKQAQAQQYAQAVFQAMLERWQAALDTVSERFSQDPDLFATITNKSESLEARIEALESILPDDVAPEIVNLLKLLVQEGDIELLPSISSALTEVGSGERQPVKADITSAVELSDSEKESIRTALVKQYGENLLFSFRVDPALMGGLRVRVGDRLIDTSIASRLAALRESLSAIVR